MIKNSISKALAIAEEAHRGQKDKGGSPYIHHPLRIARNIIEREPELSDEYLIVGLMHDVLEDTYVTTEQLSSIFSNDVLEAIQAMTRNTGESYMDFIKRVKSNRIACKIKQYDIEDNMDLSRLKSITKEDIDRNKKYEKALKLLKGE